MSTVALADVDAHYHWLTEVHEWDRDALAWANRRALDAGLGWLNPEGDNEASTPRLRHHLRRLPRVLVHPDVMARLGVPGRLVVAEPGNVLTTAGITRMLNLLIAAGGLQAYDATHTRVMVGDGGGSAPTGAAGDTDLTAIVNAANRYDQLVSGASSVATNVLTTTATFATGNGNFHWFEFGYDQGTASAATAATAPLLNHKGLDMGTKSSAVAWSFSGTITIT